MVAVLFVCLGNICRSPTAEAVFIGLTTNQFTVDSCGTGGGSSGWYLPNGYSYHEGDPADSRMCKAAKKRGYNLTSRSRPLTLEDFHQFDYIIGMDQSNIRAIEEAAAYWGGDNLLEIAQSKTRRMCDFCTVHKNVTSVPDPYYGGPQGFETVIDLLEDACQGLLQHIAENEHKED